MPDNEGRNILLAITALGVKCLKRFESGAKQHPDENDQRQQHTQQRQHGVRSCRSHGTNIINPIVAIAIWLRGYQGRTGVLLGKQHTAALLISHRNKMEPPARIEPATYVTKMCRSTD